MISEIRKVRFNKKKEGIYMLNFFCRIKGKAPIRKSRYWLCGNCRKIILRSDNYCSCCGVKVKWRDKNE